LGLAAMVSAGLDGIARRIDPGPPNLGNLYERSLKEIQSQGLRLLPQSLHEALAEFEQDEILRGSLGVIANEFLDLKSKEWKTYEGQVTPWEVQQYLTWF